MKPDLKLVEDTGSALNDAEAAQTEQAALAEAAGAPEQTEMPFAMVDGEPYTQMPRDLYIPPDALQVFLEAFEGPLDLLLYLIRKQNLDILDIPIAEITRQYMGYIDVMQELQLELAGEYLLMAAMLAEIKSRMLLPRAKAEDGQEEEDPRAELVRRLQEYERFKKAADDIDHLKRVERDVLPALVELTERKVVKLQPEVTLDEMLKAFRDVVRRSEHFIHHHVQREPLSQRQRMAEIISQLETAEFVEFIKLFRPDEGRMGVTVTFIAILELMKEGLLDIVQAEPYAPLHVRKATGRREEATPESADADNQAALAQAELPDENVVDDEDLPEPEPVAEVVAERSVEDIVEELISDSEIATIEDALQEESATETIDSEFNDGKTNND
ncbi:MAG TPA: ScpA family protein [Steroidobacteraceae bacterium]|nr:ScpA family protein [Steroidobacteraceae bacterium]